MQVTTTALTRAAGGCAAAAGAIFVGVQVGHPPLDASTIGTTEVLLRDSAKLVMSALALAGVTGIYLRQVRQVGVLGLVGYLLFAAGYLVMFSVEAMTVFVLPTVAGTDPAYVDDVLTAGTGGTPAGDIGQLQTWFLVNGIAYMLGGLLFGIALFRARVLPRWASALLAVGTVSTAALSVLPDALNRPFAVPTGIALIGLGVALWRDPRSASVPAAAAQPRTGQPAVR
jgi:hypothetical protein